MRQRQAEVQVACRGAEIRLRGSRDGVGGAIVAPVDADRMLSRQDRYRQLVADGAQRLGSAVERDSRDFSAGRQADHRFLASLPGADTFVVEEGGSPVALGHARTKAARDARVLERLVVRPDADPVAPILAGLVRAAAGGRIEGCIPGPNPVLPILLEAGFRIVDQDTFLASDGDIADPARLLPNGGLL